ncbi:MAG: hypothetical protein PWP20_1673 [Eubacteriaceae bacterium]|nr:hypothetical protein [Eubacteriaceae bacterium]
MRFALSKKTEEIRLLSKLKSVRLLKLTVAKQRTMRLSSPLRFDSSRQVAGFARYCPCNLLLRNNEPCGSRLRCASTRRVSHQMAPSFWKIKNGSKKRIKKANTLAFLIRFLFSRAAWLVVSRKKIPRHPILPGSHPPSTFGARGLYYCVRYGNRISQFIFCLFIILFFLSNHCLSFYLSRRR